MSWVRKAGGREGRTNAWSEELGHPTLLKGKAHFRDSNLQAHLSGGCRHVHLEAQVLGSMVAELEGSGNTEPQCWACCWG